MSMSRLLPAILLLGGGGIAVKGGGDVGREVVDTVKTVMTRYELSEAARHLELDSTLGHVPPRTTSQLAAWLGDNHRARFARDPASDLWQHPYQLHRGRRGRFALISLGANGVRDTCVGANPDADRRRLKRAGQRRKHAVSTQSNAARLAIEDDICAWVTTDTGTRSGGGVIGDRRHVRDSPFRQIRHDDEDED